MTKLSHSLQTGSLSISIGTSTMGILDKILIVSAIILLCMWIGSYW